MSSKPAIEKPIRRLRVVQRLAVDEGASLAEYSLLCVLIAVVVAVALPPVANAIIAGFQTLAAAF